MTAFGLGPVAGTSMAQAADIVMSETGDLVHLPQLPQRGLGSDAIGRTASLLPALSVDRGPRSWRLTARPQLATRRMWDEMERDLDIIQEVWGEYVPHVKVQAVGTWSLAAAVELSNGHRVITDRGALEDLHQALVEGTCQHMAEVARRFHAEVLLQIDEPLLPKVLAGTLDGTTDFDAIPAVPAEVALSRLQDFNADFLHTAPLWEVASAAPTLLLDFSGLAIPRHVDGMGLHLDAGYRVGLGLEPGDPRAAAIAVARHIDALGYPRELLQTSVDVFPAEELASASDYAFAARVAEMLDKDAGDL